MTVLLEVRDLAKRFPVRRGLLRRRVGWVHAVSGVSFSLAAGETLALVGESGCGKTTTGRAILRLVEPDEGQVWISGTEITSLGAEALRQMRRKMQIVFQDPYSSLNPRMTVGQTLSGPMLLHGLASESDVSSRVSELLERVGLQAGYASRYPHEFSGGQRQRIGIARAIAVQPSLIVADEAVSALDVSVQAQIINLLSDLRDEMGLGYLFIAHDLSVVRHIADTVAVMYLGRIVEFARRDTLFSEARHPYTQALLSAVPRPNPRANKTRMVLSGEVPSPMNPPSGCAFHSRCPLAFDRCRTERPAKHLVSSDHSVACHLYQNEHGPVSIDDREGARLRA
ncbi:MAG: dipeptide ABC transporter ATP-binding protein [Myxococcota bacterium]